MSNRLKKTFVSSLALASITAASALSTASSLNLNKALGNPGFSREGTAIAVIDAESGQPLAMHNQDIPLNPASCMKILTAAAALSSLGPNYRMKTSFYSEQEPRGGVINNLYMHGTGDPMLVSEEIWRAARDIRGVGIQKITGAIIIDDSFFDSHEFPRKNGNDARAYAAKTSAAAVNFNAITIKVAPGDGTGSPAIVSVEPPVDYISIVNKIKTGGKYNVGISSSQNSSGETFVLTGSIPKNAGVQAIHRSISDPIKFAASALAFALRQNGVEVSSTVRHATVPQGAHLIVKKDSRPISELLRSMNKFSNNFIAEQIAKHMGAVRFGNPGSTSKGMSVISEYMRSIGIPQESFLIENGSGLSDQTRITANALAHVLASAYSDFAIRPDLVSSFAIMGVDGTTRNWKIADRVRGIARTKTGTLGGVSTLAGYVPMKNGRIAAFAILVNGLPKGADAAHRAEVEVVKMIAEATP
ncbi:MAG TPA: D-alanyl-D-alanine carboxypeptidase/D-alanyl-D-alanine-endopeptidase [bacterium]|nr:D-alanyl-D-alanine carboxypeptidase/D-alanyl-D-alanine-endopeptidase [bacterium]